MSLPLKLRYMGFCGADDSVNPMLLTQLSYHYPFIEWGVLFHPDREGQPRYATMAWVKKLGEIKANVSHDIHLAGHLCGRRCEEILEGNFDFPQTIYDLGFRRIQINATLANNVRIDMSKKFEIIDNLKLCIIKYPFIEWIIQSNQETMFIVDELIKNPPSNMVLLYDASCGLGVTLTEDTIPCPHATIACGYAGGIGPKTISNILILLNKFITPHNKSIWIDMESSLRTYQCDTKDDVSKGGQYKDIFSITKCYECIQLGTNLLSLESR